MSNAAHIATTEAAYGLPDLTGTVEEIAGAREIRVRMLDEVKVYSGRHPRGSLERRAFWEVFVNEKTAAYWLEAQGFRRSVYAFKQAA